MYMICNGHGDQLNDGIQGHDRALRDAQARANQLQTSVWVYGPDDTDETAEEVEPE
jgi:hypothetical protein